MKKKLILLLVVTLITQVQLLAQCSIRPYTPDWDWRGSSNYTFYVHDVNGQPITETYVSPWFEQNNSNTNSFKLQNPKDYEPADGWVLVQRDFGSAVIPTDNPYFILYNKYSGILRIFVAVTKTFGPYNSAVITLSYQDSPSNQVVRTAILENHNNNSFRNALDNFENQIPEINVPNSYSNSLPFWLYADFVMNYDPCTCNNLSQLKFEAKLISAASLVFLTNGTVVQGIDATGNGGSERQSVTKDIQGTLEAGNSFVTSGEDGVANIKKLFPSLPVKSDAAIFEKILGLGDVIGIVDFLSGLFGGSSQPMSYDVNLTSTGSITTTDPYRRVITENPGSANTSLVPPTLLEYNNTMGVFNLLETPQLYFATDNCLGRICPGHNYKVKLAKDLSYVINPETNFDPNSLIIEGSIIFEVPTGYVITDSYNTLIDEGVVGNKHVFRTEYLPIGCLTSLTNKFYSSTSQISVYVKVITTFKPLNNSKTVVYASKFDPSLIQYSDPTQNSALYNDPTLWLSVYDAITDNIIYQGTNLTHPIVLSDGDGVPASNSITFGSYAVAQPSNLETWVAGNYVRVTTGAVSGSGAVLRANTRLKVMPPNVCPTPPQGDPSPICSSTTNTYYTKSHAFARENTDKGSAEVAKAEEKTTTAYPNPSNGKFTFKYYLEDPTQVQLNLSDLAGRVIASPVNEYQESGSHEVTYDAINLPAGVYVYTLVTDKGKDTKRLVIVK